MGTDFRLPPQKGAKIGGPRYRTTHPNKIKQTQPLKCRQEMGLGLTFSLSVLRLYVIVIMPAVMTPATTLGHDGLGPLRRTNHLGPIDPSLSV